MATHQYRQLGLDLMNWHSSGSDPIYAVGSSMFAGVFDASYSRQIIQDAIHNLNRINDKGATKLAKRLEAILDKMPKLTVAEYAKLNPMPVLPFIDGYILAAEFAGQTGNEYVSSVYRVTVAEYDDGENQRRFTVTGSMIVE